MNLTGVEREYLLLHYSGTDKLYIPTDQLDRVTRFIGMGDAVLLRNQVPQNGHALNRKSRRAFRKLLAISCGSIVCVRPH